MGIIEILIVFIVVVVTVYFISAGSANSKKIKKESTQQQPTNSIKQDIEKTLEDRATSMQIVDKNFLKNSFAKNINITNIEKPRKEEVELKEDKSIAIDDELFKDAISISDEADQIEEDDFYEEDYDIGIGSSFVPTSSIAKEYSELSPEMKMILTSNVLGKNNEKQTPDFEEVDLDITKFNPKGFDE